MNFKKAALLASATLGLGAVFAYAVSRPQDSKVHLQNAEFEQCVTDAVASVYPAAKGGLVLAADRHEDYQEFGDMLHFRERGLRTVNSVMVGMSGDGGIDVYAGTRKGPLILPSSVFPNLTDALERQYFMNGRLSDEGAEMISPGVTGSPEADKVSADQVTVIKKILACGSWKP